MNTQETTTEEITVEEAAPVEAEVTIDEVETASETGKEPSTKKDEPLTIDYKKNYEDLQSRIAADAFKYRKQKRQENGEEGDDSEDLDPNKPLTMAEVQKMLAENQETVAKQFKVKEATQIAATLTSSEDEAKLALSLWEHISLPFDTMEEQMEFIVAGMNAKRVLGQNAELKRALISKTTARKDTATSVRTPQPGGQPKVAGDVLAALKNSGYKYDSAAKVYVKDLANGKKLYNDGKGKTWTA